MSDKPQGSYERILFTLFALGALILLLSMLLIVYDVIARNIGISPFEHTIALTEYGLYQYLDLKQVQLQKQRQVVRATLSASTELAECIEKDVCDFSVLRE